MSKILTLVIVLALTACCASVVLAADQPANSPAPTAPPAKEKKQPANKPFGDVMVTLDGVIKNIGESKGKGKKVVTFDLVTEKDTVKIFLAGAAVLKFKGLSLTEGTKATVAGWQLMDNNGANPYVIGREVTINGVTVTLLNLSGERTWTDFDVSPIVTLDGTITKLEQPLDDPLKPAEPAKTADPAKPAAAPVTAPTGDAPKTDAPKADAPATPKPPKKKTNVSFTLVVNEKESYRVEVGPISYTQEQGLILTEGAKVNVVGWQINAHKLTAREITFGGQTYTLRDAAGKEAWAKPAKTRGGEKSATK